MTKIIRLFTVLALALATVANAGVANTKTQSLNESARGWVGTGDRVPIVGIIVHGKDYVRVVIRGLSPTLAQFNLHPVLQRLSLTVYRQDGSVLVSQLSYLENSATDNQEIADNGLTPPSVNECAVILNLAPGNYTAIIRGLNGQEGFGLAEIYKLGL